MAAVRIDFEDLDDDALPDLCMKCGAPALVRKNRRFSWTPPWVIVLILFFLLPGIIVSLVLTKRRLVAVPLCEQHQGHWSKRAWASLIGFGVVLLAVAAGFASLSLGRPADDLAPWFFLSALLALVAWLIFVAMLQSGTIRPAEITDYTITLQNVGVDFARAYEEERLGRRSPLDRRQLERWNRGPSRTRQGDESDVRRPGPSNDAFERG